MSSTYSIFLKQLENGWQSFGETAPGYGASGRPPDIHAVAIKGSDGTLL
jgi:hypothetical protein